MLIRLLYASRAAEPLSPEAIDAILAQARAHNPALGVTGILCYSGDLFLQALEGGREAVNRLYREIVRDPRHLDVQLLHYQEIEERLFSAWTMGQVNLAKVNPSLLLKYSARPVLDPYSVSGKASIALLTELACANVIGRS